MAVKIINTLLLIATVIGAVFAYQASRNYRRWLAIHTRLESRVGSFTIRDRSKVHIRAVESGDPMEFAWRVYVPANVKVGWYPQIRDAALSSPSEFIARVRFEVKDDGRLDIALKQQFFILGMDFSSRDLADLLPGRWDEIRVERLGSDGVVEIEVDELAPMLRLTLPDDMRKPFEEECQFVRIPWGTIEDGVFVMNFGADQAFQQTKAGK